MSPRWRKVWRDLWQNKTRTLLVVFSIAVGVFAVGTVVHTQIVVAGSMQSDYESSNPASASVFSNDMDAELVQSIRRMPEVEDVEGRSSMTLQIRVGVDEWKSISIVALPDFENDNINRVFPVYNYIAAPDFGAERTNWPPDEKEILFEQSTFLQPGRVPPILEVGDTIWLELSDGKQREITVAGLVHEPNTFPATFRDQAIGYVNYETFEWLGGSRNFDELEIVVAGDRMDREHVTDVARKIEDRLQKTGRFTFVNVNEPGQLPLQFILQGVSGVLIPLGLMSLLLSGFLVVNTISAILAQQTRQIGVMKAIGASRGQIMSMYVAVVVIFGLLALCIAVPLGALVAGQTMQLLAGFLNVPFPEYSLPPIVLVIEIAVGLVVPLLAALVPITRATGITVREAIADYGLGSGAFGTGLIDRLVSSIRGLSRPLLISLRNTFRRRGRLALTLLTLILGGTIFISVMNVRSSLALTLEDAFDYYQFDVQVSFSRAYRIEQIEQIAYRVPGVTDVEGWGAFPTRRIRPDDTESEQIIVLAPPADTNMIEPKLIEGRWLLPEDENALVISQEILRQEPDIAVGDTITLDSNNEEQEWTVVGVAKVVGAQPLAYANYSYFSRTLGNVGRVGQVQLKTVAHSADYQNRVLEQLQTEFENEGIRTGSTQTSSAIRQQNEFFFNIIVVLLLVMSILIAAVGALGLMGTMSINVLERTREIGVLRAIGASNRAVRRIVIVEGVLIGLISWVIGAFLSVPLGQVLSDAVGMAFFQTGLSYAFSPFGIVLWLIIVIILSAIASFLPAQRAASLTVREVLAYE